MRILDSEFAGVSRAVVIVYLELVTAFDYRMMPDDFQDGIGTVMSPAALDEIESNGLKFRPDLGIFCVILQELLWIHLSGLLVIQYMPGDAVGLAKVAIEPEG